ncbi:MAG: amino acid ABC transporter permease [Acetobacteraceae bacterium]
MSYTLQFGQVAHYIPYLLGGAWISLQIAFLCFWGGMAIGLVNAVALAFGNRLAAGLARAYVTFFTNTPGLVQIYFIYYALPDLHVVLDSYQAVVLGIMLNAGGYLALILRSGFLSVHANEVDAAVTLGMSRWLLLRYVIVPHMLRVLYPAIGNKFILMVLGTAVAGVFGVEDLMGRTINANAESFRSVELLSITAAIYVGMTVCATFVLSAAGMALVHRRVRFAA